MRRPRLWALAIAAAFTVTGCFGARALAKRLVFPTHRVDDRPLPNGATVITLVAHDGAAVHALEIEGPPSAPEAVVFHNNRETIADGVGLARALRGRGFGVMLVEYRGYGLSQGIDPSEEGLYLDAEAALDALGRRGVGSDRVLLFGTSLGTGVAAEMARRGRGSALVLVTPYTSIPDLAEDVVPLLPANALLDDRFETLSKASQIHVPTLVIHGDRDEIVPFWMGARVAGAIAGARFLRVAGGHHGDLFAKDSDRLLGAIATLSARSQ
jgi:pimeloyl-ACP methyl ester carboxylesterase